MTLKYVKHFPARKSKKKKISRMNEVFEKIFESETFFNGTRNVQDLKSHLISNSNVRLRDDGKGFIVWQNSFDIVVTERGIDKIYISSPDLGVVSEFLIENIRDLQIDSREIHLFLKDGYLTFSRKINNGFLS